MHHRIVCTLLYHPGAAWTQVRVREKLPSLCKLKLNSSTVSVLFFICLESSWNLYVNDNYSNLLEKLVVLTLLSLEVNINIICV